jgi:hypothetical protein
MLIPSLAKESVDERFAAIGDGPPDTFRLAIRAHALIGEKLDELLGYAFVGDVPSFVRGPSFQRKVDLCVALGLMSPAFANVINRFTKLRNELAHGGDEVSAQDAKEIHAALHEFQPSLADLADFLLNSEDPSDLLKTSLMLMWAGLLGCVAVAENRRAETREALETRWKEAAELGVMLFQADLRFARGAGYWPGSEP